MNQEPSLPLWRQLQATAGVLVDIRCGKSATVAVARVDSVLRPGVQALVFHVLRSLGRAEALRKALAKRAPPPMADALLCCALALAWRDEDAPYEAFTLVNQAVEAAKRSFELRSQSGFINACLRRFLREREALVAITQLLPVALWNHPAWWIAKLQKDYPCHWQSILEANNRHAPMTLRVNATQSTPERYVEKLASSGVGAQVVGDWAVALTSPRPVQTIPGFAEGEVSVQDAAAQLAAPLLLNGLTSSAPLRVLDACAAPGGKTAHLLELGLCQVTALDVDPLRCERIHQTLQRLGLRARVLTGDAGAPAVWWDGELFDAILLDAPCTASGIVRRHPDVRWLRRESDVAQMVVIQMRLLKTLWTLLKPGGRLVYCTCSVFLDEGERQIQTFLARNSEATLLPSPGHLMPATAQDGRAVPDNQPSDHDGFYYAVLAKHAA